LLVTGGYLVYLGARTLGPDDRYEPTRATTVGIVAGLAGVAAVGAGLYLLWHHDDGPTVTPTAGGAVVGWSGRFQ
jgi:hypothetical protein